MTTATEKAQNTNRTRAMGLRQALLPAGQSKPQFQDQLITSPPKVETRPNTAFYETKSSFLLPVSCRINWYAPTRILPTCPYPSPSHCTQLTVSLKT